MPLWILGGFVVVSLLGRFMREAHERERDELDAELHQFQTEALEQFERALESDDGTAQSMESNLLGMQNYFQAMAARLRGDDMHAALGFVNTVEDMLPAARTYDGAMAELHAFHPLEFGSIRTHEDVQRRLRAIDHCTLASEMIIEALHTFPGRLRDSMRETGTKSSTVDRLVEATVQDGWHMFAARARKLDLVVLAAMREVLELLDDHWELWEWNADTEQVVTHSEHLLGALNMLLERVEGATAEQEAAQRLFLRRFREQVEAGSR